jgi:hypothetical protein
MTGQRSCHFEKFQKPKPGGSLISKIKKPEPRVSNKIKELHRILLGLYFE